MLRGRSTNGTLLGRSRGAHRLDTTRSRSVRRSPLYAPGLGAHTDKVLGDLLGLGSMELSELHAQGVVK